MGFWEGLIIDTWYTLPYFPLLDLSLLAMGVWPVTRFHSHHTRIIVRVAFPVLADLASSVHRVLFSFSFSVSLVLSMACTVLVCSWLLKNCQCSYLCIASSVLVGLLSIAGPKFFQMWNFSSPCFLSLQFLPNEYWILWFHLCDIVSILTFPLFSCSSFFPIM